MFLFLFGMTQTGLAPSASRKVLYTSLLSAITRANTTPLNIGASFWAAGNYASSINVDNKQRFVRPKNLQNWKQIRKIGRSQKKHARFWKRIISGNYALTTFLSIHFLPKETLHNYCNHLIESKKITFLGNTFFKILLPPTS